MDEAKWYVAHTYSGYENKVKANIEKTVENRNLQDQIFEVLVPLETVVDVRVLAEDGSEIELKENIDEGDTDLRSVIEGDSKRYSQNESFGNYGYQEQEFKDGELTDVEHDEYTAEADGYTDDDYADVSDDNGSDDEE